MLKDFPTITSCINLWPPYWRLSVKFPLDLDYSRQNALHARRDCAF